MKIIKRILKVLKKYSDNKYWRTRNVLVLVYTSSKVGSSSVYSSIKKTLPRLSIAHFHFLTERKLQQFSDEGKWMYNVRIAEKTKQTIETNNKKRKKIITLVRDPVAREVSGVFQSWKEIFKITSVEDLNYDMVIDYVNNKSLSQTENWFKTEFLEYTGLDITSYPFDKDKGYSIIKTDEYDILILKLEKLNSVFNQALKEFLKLNINQIKSNESVNEEGKDLYLKVKTNFHLEVDRLEKVYSSRFIKHFYTDEEIKGFIEKWRPKSS